MEKIEGMEEEHQPLTQMTREELDDAFSVIAPVVDQTWNEALDSDALWRQRAEHYGRFRTWWLRWQLRRRYTP